MYCLIFKKKIILKTFFKKQNNNLILNQFNNYDYFFKMNNLSKIRYINFYFYYNKKFYYNFSYINKFYYNNFINILNIYFKNGSNMLFIDDNYKYLLPVYNIIYGLKNINSEKNFFFLKIKYLTTPN
jgi:hypothetical protein